MKPRKAGTQGRIQFTLKAGGNDVDTTGSTFTLTMVLKRTRAVKFGPVAMTAISQSPSTVVYYDPILSDLNTPGLYLLEVKEIRSNSAVEPYPSDLYEELLLEPML
jgi:hypothetical protein